MIKLLLQVELFLVLGNLQIVILTYYRSYLQWLRYNDGRRNIIYENYKIFFSRDAQQNENKIENKYLQIQNVSWIELRPKINILSMMWIKIVSYSTWDPL